MSYPGYPLCELACKSADIDDISVSNVDIFGCLCELRKILEEKDLSIACYGARVDSYSFGLSRNMAGGAKLYLLKTGKVNELSDLHWIFEETDSKFLGTLSEQFAYYKSWLKEIYYSV
ncbi:hypothetical protein [[Leptolyngbya] sp. PCC 7376]|uniref:hypothetical protein n=1 Tax=[Leptolyngbya] sp. PCC 7376 TaxID=111781 RepID=UPI0005A14278|nr:hypothetical protein [[Leptolyngbya] sp. PCC 7376]